MSTDLKALWQRERTRRKALWDLEGLCPGSEHAKPHIAILDEIDHLDREEPLGEACWMSVDELRESVPETKFTGTDGYPFVIVLDQHIPQPWHARFEAASALATRLPQGGYAITWRRFLRGWVYEMQHLAAHRERCTHD